MPILGDSSLNLDRVPHETNCGARFFFSWPSMTDEERKAQEAEVVKADWERTVWSGWAAECELGPFPDPIRDPKGFKVYVRAYNKLAMTIFKRLN